MPIDFIGIRSGDTKYIVRELFKELYLGGELPAKIPMSRPMNEWLAMWTGLARPVFLSHYTDNMIGDPTWLVLALDWFLITIK